MILVLVMEMRMQADNQAEDFVVPRKEVIRYVDGLLILMVYYHGVVFAFVPKREKA